MYLAKCRRSQAVLKAATKSAATQGGMCKCSVISLAPQQVLQKPSLKDSERGATNWRAQRRQGEHAVPKIYGAMSPV